MEKIDSVYTKELEIYKRVVKEVCIDVSQCQLNKKDLTILLHQISKLMNTTVLSIHSHSFTPQGDTIMAIIADSHIAIHTWPEYKYVAIDIFSCKQNIPDNIFSYIKTFFETEDITYHTLFRKFHFNNDK